MIANQTRAGSILQKSGLHGVSHVINPYTGCVHRCVYCYARFMKRFSGHNEAWGTFLDIKINGVDLLSRQLAKRRQPLRETVLLSSVTDPYQPPERKFRLTRGLLKVLLEYQIPVSILTKSDLVLRDLDLLTQFDSCIVGLSLMTISDKAAGRIEPRATPPIKRLQALRALQDHGIRTYAFISPTLPGITDLEPLFEALAGSVDEVGLEAINMIGGNWRGVEHVLRKYYPDQAQSCARLSRDGGYWNQLERQLDDLCEEYHIENMGFFRH